MCSIEAYNIFHLSGNHHASSDGGIPLPVLSTTYALVFTGSDTEVHWKLVTIILEKISSAENSVQWENDWGVQEYPCNYSITLAWRQTNKRQTLLTDKGCKCHTNKINAESPPVKRPRLITGAK